MVATAQSFGTGCRRIRPRVTHGTTKLSKVSMNYFLTGIENVINLVVKGQGLL